MKPRQSQVLAKIVSASCPRAEIMWRGHSCPRPLFLLLLLLPLLLLLLLLLPLLLLLLLLLPLLLLLLLLLLLPLPLLLLLFLS